VEIWRNLSKQTYRLPQPNKVEQPVSRRHLAPRLAQSSSKGLTGQFSRNDRELLDAAYHFTSSKSTAVIGSLILISPMKARLMHYRANIILLFILSIIKDLSDPHRNILFEQHPSPSPPFTHALPPTADLSLIIITPPAHEETTVPLEPSSYVMIVVDPARGLPLFNTLPTFYFVLVYFRIVGRACEISLDAETRDPRSWKLFVIVYNCSPQFPRVQWAEVGASKTFRFVLEAIREVSMMSSQREYCLYVS